MRSLPDIFKHHFFQVREEDVVLIPGSAPQDFDGEEEPPADSLRPEGEIDPEEMTALPESSQPEEAEPEDASPDSLIRRYKERLSLGKEAFFNTILPELQEELQQRLEEMLDQIYREELMKRRQEIQKSLEFLGQGLQALEASHQVYIKEFTEELKYMALDIAERILQREIQADPKALETMILELVAEVKNAPWINVEVSEQVEGLAEHLKAQLSKAEQGKTIFVTAKDVPPDTCRIETEDGFIEATLSVQLQQLRQAFVQAEEEGD